MANLLDVVREEFFSRLQTQTNWGRNQIKELYTQVQLDILSANTNNEEILGESVKFTLNKNHWDNLQKGTHKNIIQDISKPQPDDYNEYPFKDDEDIKRF